MCCHNKGLLLILCIAYEGLIAVSLHHRICSKCSHECVKQREIIQTVIETRASDADKVFTNCTCFAIKQRRHKMLCPNAVLQYKCVVLQNKMKKKKRNLNGRKYFRLK